MRLGFFVGHDVLPLRSRRSQHTWARVGSQGSAPWAGTGGYQFQYGRVARPPDAHLQGVERIPIFAANKNLLGWVLLDRCLPQGGKLKVLTPADQPGQQTALPRTFPELVEPPSSPCSNTQATPTARIATAAGLIYRMYHQLASLEQAVHRIWVAGLADREDRSSAPVSTHVLTAIIGPSHEMQES